MITEDQKEQYRKALEGQESKTTAELARELGVGVPRLSHILKELGLSRPKGGRSTARKDIPREEFEREVRAGRSMGELCLDFGVSNQVIYRHARKYGLVLRSKFDISAELAAQGLRRCVTCKETKSLETEFYNHYAGPLSKNTRCQECQRRQRKEYQQGYKRRARGTGALLTRRCADCLQDKPLETNFEPDPKGQRRRSNQCHDCLKGKRERALNQAANSLLEENGVRRCCTCLEIKLLESDFSTDRRARRGRTYDCRACHSQKKARYAKAAASAQPTPAHPPNALPGSRDSTRPMPPAVRSHHQAQAGPDFTPAPQANGAERADF